MRKLRKNNGFSLTEVLMSIGVLAMGMIFVAGVFPVGLYFATISTERSIAAVVADEAFAKVRLYGLRVYDVNFPFLWPSPIPRIGCVDFNDKDVSNKVFFRWEYAYPSGEYYAYHLEPDQITSQKAAYSWSAICRFTNPDIPPPSAHLVEVTVFVCRKAGASEHYRDPIDPTNSNRWVYYPRPVKVLISAGSNSGELVINNVLVKTFINDGYTIIDNATGQLYRVLERYAAPRDQIILLDRPWQTVTWPNVSPSVWVIPPPFGGGRNPCIAVYQRTMRF